MSVEAVAFSEILNAEYPRFTKVAAKILRHHAGAEMQCRRDYGRHGFNALAVRANCCDCMP